MQFVLRVSGNEEVLTPALDMFVKHHGWNESEGDKIAFAETVLKGFMRQSIQAQAAKSAREAASAAASAAVGSALDMTTTVLSEEDDE